MQTMPSTPINKFTSHLMRAFTDHLASCPDRAKASYKKTQRIEVMQTPPVSNDRVPHG
eukprot:CAMPEP_0183411038 /NCGR_PEP_ID=MMETSP0370-20130417/20020_1 /TAXON_ID=268820 /ORGANISM="Peridinium aciculiferum, Strain PAER-2" /LENGTH=57 /DNA_ID=CAMNT_0025593955 /DNA_START=72 /DNA_END=241 /DNA_ORIENTATION=+